MGPAQAIWNGIAKSFEFSGRASRSEFWWFAAAVAILMLFLVVIRPARPVGTILYGDSQSGALTTRSFPARRSSVWKTLLPLSLLVPLPAAVFRRMHDTGYPVWWAFVGPGFGIAMAAVILKIIVPALPRDVLFGGAGADGTTIRPFLILMLAPALCVAVGLIAAAACLALPSQNPSTEVSP